MCARFKWISVAQRVIRKTWCCAERIATYVMRALLYKNTKRIYAEVSSLKCPSVTPSVVFDVCLLPAAMDVPLLRALFVLEKSSFTRLTSPERSQLVLEAMHWSPRPAGV